MIPLIVYGESVARFEECFQVAEMLIRTGDDHLATVVRDRL